MNLEEANNNLSGKNLSQKIVIDSAGERSEGAPENLKDDILMDYENLAEAKGSPAKETHEIHIGLNGGQSKDDQRGLDISQYAGPESKDSNQFDDPDAPYHTGPGNGLSGKDEDGDERWENPHPQNDSF